MIMKILKDHFVDPNKTIEMDRAREELAILKKRRSEMRDEYAKKSYKRKLEILPKLDELTRQIGNIENRLEGIK